MRLIHTFEQERDGKRFVEALFGESIEADLRDEKDGWALWIRNDDDIELAEQILAVFLETPNDERIALLLKESKRRQGEIAAKEKKSRHKEMRARDAFNRPTYGPVTIAIGLIAVFIAMGTRLGEDSSAFTFVQMDGYQAAVGNYIAAHPELQLDDWRGVSMPTSVPSPTEGDPPYIFDGAVLEMPRHKWAIRTQWALNTWRREPWRLFTPMVLHFGIIHIVFNLWWWKDLGAALERKHGSLRFFLSIILYDLGASFFEFFLGDSVNFGGLSGVVYALLGFLWIRGKFDPTYPYQLSPRTVLWMGAWFVICWLGIVGSVANWAHTGGLLLGMAAGFFSSGALRRRFLRRRP